jgi:hypothetical protein
MYKSTNQWYILPNSTNDGGGTSYTTNVLPTWELNFLTLRLHVNETWDEITGGNE